MTRPVDLAADHPVSIWLAELRWRREGWRCTVAPAKFGYLWTATHTGGRQVNADTAVGLLRLTRSTHGCRQEVPS